jgi:hypothetical protein
MSRHASTPVKSNHNPISDSESSPAPSYKLKPYHSVASTFRYKHKPSYYQPPISTSTPLRGTARTLFALDDDVKRDLQIYVFGHCEGVQRGSRDEGRFVYYLSLGEEVNRDAGVGLTEEMRGDLRMWIDGIEEEEVEEPTMSAASESSVTKEWGGGVDSGGEEEVADSIFEHTTTSKVSSAQEHYVEGVELDAYDDTLIKTERKTRLRRCSSVPSLAALMALAEDSDGREEMEESDDDENDVYNSIGRIERTISDTQATGAWVGVKLTTFHEEHANVEKEADS